MDFEKLYKTCYMQVYSYMVTLSRDPHLAEEITQNTFFKVMTAGQRSRFREEAKVSTWLCAIAKNLYIDEMRKQKRFTSMPEEYASDHNPLEAIEDRAMTFKIHQILHEMKDPYKEVFQLRVFGELPFAQIGKLFGKSENWARVTYHRAKLKIQERIKLNE